MEDYEGTIHDRSDRSDREVSYYELALTNRQVFVAIVLLLIGLSGAFLAGAWFGSGARTRPAVRQAATPAPAPAKPSGEQLDEYRFFSEKQAARSPQSQPAAESAPASATSDPSSAPSAPPVEAAAKNAVPIPAPEPSTLAADVGAEPAPRATAGPSSPASAAPAASSAPSAPAVPASSPARAAPEPASAPKPAVPAGDLWVQVFSTADAAQARRVADQLSGAGYRAVVSRGGAAGGAPLERVRVGPFRDRAEAQRVADDVRRKLKFSTWITSTQ